MLVTDAHNGTSRRQHITVTYEDAKTYLGDFREARIPYITEIVDETKYHCLNVWVSGETVLYLPAPLTNLDARQSMMVAQTYGKRWREQDGDNLSGSGHGRSAKRTQQGPTSRSESPQDW